MSDQIVLYYNPMSRARTVHWLLEELGVPYRLELTRFDTGEHKTPEFLGINPMGKLPTLIHRGVVITESAAICTYLADAFPAAKLAPALDSLARGTYLRWMFFGAGCFEPALVDKMVQRNEVRASTLGYGSWSDTLHALETAFTPGPYVLGEQFSAVDIYLGSGMGWGMFTKTLEPRAAFLAYQERLKVRPAFQRFVKQNEELAAQLKT